MPLAAMTDAASCAKRSLLTRQSKQMAMPREHAPAPSALMTSANACVAWRMTWMFMRRQPSAISPRRPAVPNSSGAKKRLSISFLSSRMALSSSHSALESAGLSSQRWYSSM